MKYEKLKEKQLHGVQRWVRVEIERYDLHVFKDIEEKWYEVEIPVEFDHIQTSMYNDLRGYKLYFGVWV